MKVFLKPKISFKNMLKVKQVKKQYGVEGESCFYLLTVISGKYDNIAGTIMQ